MFRDLAAKIMHLCVGTAFRTVSNLKPTSFVTGQLILQFDPLRPKAFDIGQRHFSILCIKPLLRRLQARGVGPIVQVRSYLGLACLPD